MKSIKRPFLAALSLLVLSLPVAHAAPATPSAESSAGPAPSSSANAGPAGARVSAHAWPKETSEQPKEEEWAGATELEMVTTVAQSGWTKKPVKCRQRALREWVRVECMPPDPPTESLIDAQRYYGSVWGLAGDIAGASGKFQLVSTLEPFKTPAGPDDFSGRIVRKMGAVGTVTFQAKYGSAAVFRLDEIFWAEQYDGGGNVMLDKGIVIDVSWALGEKHPTIVLHG